MRRSLVRSRTEAQQAIEAGLVTVAGIAVPKAASLVDTDTAVQIIEPPSPYVSRGGHKLEGALDTFAVDVEGAHCLDVGASTGGFTDCLLQRGAASVVALDVGYGQLDWKLRNDERVTVVDRTNIRYVVPQDIGAPFDIVVCDVSFIALAKIAQALAACGGESTDFVLLVKPQFEVGRGRVGPGGIVRDSADWVDAVDAAATALDNAGVGVVGAVPSSITGTKGNQEFLVHARRGPRAMDERAIEEVIAP